MLSTTPSAIVARATSPRSSLRTLTPPQPIVLSEDQRINAQKLYEILLTNHLAINTSPTGSGKTVVAIWLAQHLRLRPAIVCPANMVPQWQRECAKYGVVPVFILSYGGLRSTGSHQPKHGYLEKTVTFDGRGKKIKSFAVTTPFAQELTNPILLIADEAQNVKNPTTQNAALRALCVHMLHTAEARSRILLLSATLFDKEELVINYLKLAGFTRRAKLCGKNPRTGRFELYGAGDIIDIANLYNGTETKKVLEEFGGRERLRTDLIKPLCFQLFRRCFLPRLSAAMPPPRTPGLTIQNAYIPVTLEEGEALELAIDELATMVSFRPTGEGSGTVDDSVPKAALGCVLRKIHTLKARAAARFAKQLLERERCKIVFYSDFNEPLDIFQAEMAEYGVLPLRGCVSMAKRTANVDTFQEANGKCRVLSCHPDVVPGRSFHDVTGEWKRYVLMLPDYSAIRMHQAAGRVDRFGAKSRSTVYHLYGRLPHRKYLERAIIAALSSKERVLSQLHPEQVEAGIKFPGDLEDVEL